MDMPLFRQRMSDEQKAKFIHENGEAAFFALPFAPPPKAEETRGLRRHKMTDAARAAFIEKYGLANFHGLPE